MHQKNMCVFTTIMMERSIKNTNDLGLVDTIKTGFRKKSTMNIGENMCISGITIVVRKHK